MKKEIVFSKSSRIEIEFKVYDARTTNAVGWWFTLYLMV